MIKFVCDLWFSLDLGTPVSSANKTEIVLKMALNTITETLRLIYYTV
jgi:hypothetical protein